MIFTMILTKMKRGGGEPNTTQIMNDLESPETRVCIFVKGAANLEFVKTFTHPTFTPMSFGQTQDICFVYGSTTISRKKPEAKILENERALDYLFSTMLSTASFLSLTDLFAEHCRVSKDLVDIDVYPMPGKKQSPMMKILAQTCDDMKEKNYNQCLSECKTVQINKL